MEQRIKFLFRKYLSNNCTAEELDEFFHFIRISDQDQTLRTILQETYQSILTASASYVNISGDLVIRGISNPFGAPVQKEKRPKRRVITIIFASAVAASLILILFLNILYNKIAGQSLAAMKKTSTEKAEYKFILLPDSTQVWLNAGSSLDYPEHFDNTIREVTLTGEAYFDVKHAEEHPFIIHTGQINTTVLGTAFNINAYTDRSNIEVSVSRGKVKVSRGNQLIAMLVKGQTVKVSQTGDTGPQKVLSTNSVAAWQQGNMMYDDESLGDIIADLQRVYNVKIQVDNKILALRISTSFRRELGISHALEILCKLTDTQLVEQNGTYIIQ
ncbi:MAG TPA: FecR domain-containing protein [Puia sp.]|jgi:ferric-dicitrate binding protein FerR (iron transport regulator)